MTLVSQTRSVVFPRSSELFSSSVPGRDSPACRIVDQRNLLAETNAMLSLFTSKRVVKVKSQSVESYLQQLLAEDAAKKTRQSSLSVFVECCMVFLVLCLA